MSLEAQIKPLNYLLTQGSCPAGDIELARLIMGLAHPTVEDTDWVLSQQLLSVRSKLLNNNELIAAILAINKDIKQSWCQIMAARCMEAGQIAVPMVLIQLITQLGEASEWVETYSHQANLSMTPFTSIERDVLGTTTEQNQATLILARVLRVAYQLSQWQKQPLNKIPSVILDGSRPDISWCSGRIIVQPGLSVGMGAWLLSDKTTAQDQVIIDVAEKNYALKSLDWVLKNPWCYLLALIAYEQNVWQVEGAGGLLLELPEGQSPYQPIEVQVLVLNIDGDELSCGTLAEFILRILNSLHMGLYPADLNKQDLNIALSPIIAALLRHKVWRYREGISGEQGQYQIHPDFSDVCYGRKGQPAFSRFARHLRFAIRTQANQWRDEIKSPKSAKINEKSVGLSPRIKVDYE